MLTATTELYHRPEVRVVQSFLPGLSIVSPFRSVKVPRLEANAPWERQREVFRLLEEAREGIFHAHTNRERSAAYWVWKECRDQIAAANLGLVHAVLKAQHPAPSDEKKSEAWIAYARAIDGYRLEFGTKFSTYSVWALRTAMTRAWRRDTTYATHYQQAGVDSVGDCLLKSAAAEAMPDRVEASETLVMLRKVFNDAPLNVNERFVIERRYLHDPKQTLSQVGAILRLTKERVRQIENDGLRKLRRAMEAGR